MATNLRTIHIGAGQVTNVAAGTYATWNDFRTSLLAGDLPLDLRAGTGVDEDWDILFYGDGVNPIYFGDTTNFSQMTDMVGDETTTITFRPAPGHGFADLMDPAVDPLTYGGPGKGVTIAPTTANRNFIAITSPLLPRITLQGLQFANLASTNSQFIVGNTDSRFLIKSCIVWNLCSVSATNYADGIVDNCLLFIGVFGISSGHIIDGKSGSNIEHYIRNNILVDTRPVASEAAIYSYHGAQGKTAAGNIFCGPWTALMDSNKTWVTTANLISGDGDSSGQFTEEGGNRFSVDPRDIFVKFTPGSNDPADYDFRLKAGSPAIAAAVGYPLPDDDIYGRMRSAVTHIGASETTVSPAVIFFDETPDQAHARSLPVDILLETGGAFSAARQLARATGMVPHIKCAAHPALAGPGAAFVRAYDPTLFLSTIAAARQGNLSGAGHMVALDISSHVPVVASVTRTRRAFARTYSRHPVPESRVRHLSSQKRTIT